MINGTMNSYEEEDVLAPLHESAQMELLRLLNRQERMVWAGSPAASGCAWGCCLPALFFLWLAVSLCGADGVFGQFGTFPLPFLMLLLLSFFALLMPFYFNYLRLRTVYAVTDSRAIIIEPVKVTPWLTRSLYFPLTPDLVKEVRELGKTGDVVFSEKAEMYHTMKVPGRQNAAFTAAYPTQIGFKNIADPHRVADIIYELTRG